MTIADPPSSRPPRRRGLWGHAASLDASAQAAVPGLYAWAITVAPAAWSRGAPLFAKVAAIVGALALVTAPIVSGAGGGRARSWARAWSVWGFALSSVTVWALSPSALSSARLDAVRGTAGMVGWALFAFASAGPALRADPSAAGRAVASASLEPRTELPRGERVYVAVGIVLALVMQQVGWSVAAPERAVLVRLVTITCGIAVISGTTSIALARHGRRVPASGRVRLRRAGPWLVMLALVTVSGVVVGLAR